mmetsp:Transcript_29903/g.91572  ORF Transcript_29903/g.91572 Transcript_29903/m.91572 type:complete len:227 (+) Transcript_29903:744-1424(+)
MGSSPRPNSSGSSSGISSPRSSESLSSGCGGGAAGRDPPDRNDPSSDRFGGLAASFDVADSSSSRLSLRVWWIDFFSCSAACSCCGVGVVDRAPRRLEVVCAERGGGFSTSSGGGGGGGGGVFSRFWWCDWAPPLPPRMLFDDVGSDGDGCRPALCAPLALGRAAVVAVDGTVGSRSSKSPSTPFSGKGRITPRRRSLRFSKRPDSSSTSSPLKCSGYGGGMWRMV